MLHVPTILVYKDHTFLRFRARGFREAAVSLRGILNPVDPGVHPCPLYPPFYVFLLLSSSSYQNVREFSVFISLSFPFCSSPLPLLPLRFSSNFPLPFHVALFSPSSLRRPPSRAVNYKVLARIIVHATTFTFARGILSIFFGQIEGRQCRGMHTPLSPQSARAAFSALRGNPIGVSVCREKSFVHLHFFCLLHEVAQKNQSCKSFFHLL